MVSLFDAADRLVLRDIFAHFGTLTLLPLLAMQTLIAKLVASHLCVNKHLLPHSEYLHTFSVQILLSWTAIHILADDISAMSSRTCTFFVIVAAVELLYLTAACSRMLADALSSPSLTSTWQFTLAVLLVIAVLACISNNCACTFEFWNDFPAVALLLTVGSLFSCAPTRQGPPGMNFWSSNMHQLPLHLSFTQESSHHHHDAICCGPISSHCQQTWQFMNELPLMIHQSVTTIFTPRQCSVIQSPAVQPNIG